MTDIVPYFLWVSVFTLLYTYIFYGILLLCLVKIKSFFVRKTKFDSFYIPQVTLLVAAYNEAECIREKIINSLHLDYPKEKITFLFVTDGSDDETPQIVREFPEIKLMHSPVREGKVNAVNRAMSEVTSDLVVFSDANTLLNRESLKILVRHFKNPGVGVVAGEKRILSQEIDDAAGTGEGAYWKYESILKKWDYELNSVMGAAGELYAIRSELYEKVPSDTLIEDFYLSFRIIQMGYKIAYEPQAYALETPSESIGEEFKRKIRIAAGGIQSIVRLKSILNPIKYGLTTFQYFSHRVLRWTLAPFALPVAFISNMLLLHQGSLYQGLFLFQLVFYLAAVVGYLLEKRQVRWKLLFLPFYFCMMNYAVFAGIKNYMQGSQSVLWAKSKRRRL